MVPWPLAIVRDIYTRSEFSFTVHCNQIRDNAKKFPKAQSITTPRGWSRVIRPAQSNVSGSPLALRRRGEKFEFLPAGNVRRRGSPAAKCNFKRTADKCAMRSTLISAQRLDRVSHKEKRVTARIRRSILSREFLAHRRETNGRDEGETIILFPRSRISAQIYHHESDKSIDRGRGGCKILIKFSLFRRSFPTSFFNSFQSPKFNYRIHLPRIPCLAKSLDS